MDFTRATCKQKWSCRPRRQRRTLPRSWTITTVRLMQISQVALPNTVPTCSLSLLQSSLPLLSLTTIPKAILPIFPPLLLLQTLQILTSNHSFFSSVWDKLVLKVLICLQGSRNFLFLELIRRFLPNFMLLEKFMWTEWKLYMSFDMRVSEGAGKSSLSFFQNKCHCVRFDNPANLVLQLLYHTKTHPIFSQDEPPKNKFWIHIKHSRNFWPTK